MNPQQDRTSGLGLPQPGSDTSQLPPIHAPQTFHAPDNALPQFGVGDAPAPDSPPSVPVTAPPAQPSTAPAPAAPQQPVSVDPLAAVTAQFTQPGLSAPQEDVDTPFDEEWVEKAKEVVGRTHADPFNQSKELSKLKAQYIKARYNKDIKVSEG